MIIIGLIGLIVLFVVGLIVYIIWASLCVAVAGILRLAFYFILIICGLIVSIYVGTYWLLLQFVGDDNSIVAALATASIGTAVIALLLLTKARERGRSRSRICLVALVGLTTGIFTLTFAEPNPFEETSSPRDTSQPITPGQTKAVTPHQAKAATTEALRRFPALGKEGSPMNKAFLELYEQAKKDDPESLALADWPLTLAARAASSTGVEAAQATTPTQEAQPQGSPPSASWMWQKRGNPLEQRAR